MLLLEHPDNGDVLYRTASYAGAGSHGSVLAE